MNNKMPFNGNNEITGKIKLKIDKDLKKLLKSSEKTGVPLIFGKDSILDYKIEGDPNFNNNIKPDFIEIGPPGFYFDLKFGVKEFKNIPFDLRGDGQTYTFMSMPYSSLDVDLEIKLVLDELNHDINSSITIKRKSNRIKDILNYEIRKRDFSNCVFQFISRETELDLEGELPKVSFDDTLFKFYKQVNHINEVFKLDIVLDEEYVLLNDDLINAELICEFIKNKKIKLNTLPISIKTSIEGLNYLLTHENNQFTLKQDDYHIKLLGNEIKLGSYRIDMTQYQIVNYNELEEIYEDNKDNFQLIKVSIVFKEKDCDELYMDFDIN